MASFPGSIYQPPTTTSGSAAAAPTAELSFATIPDTQVCGAEVILWDISGSPQNLTIFATNSSVNQPSDWPGVGRRDTPNGVTFFQLVAYNIDPTALSFSWNPVNVPVGQYIFVANAAGLSTPVRSTEFQVLNGTDTSCLSAGGSGSSSASTAPTSSSQTPQTSSQTTSSSPDNTGVPIGATAVRSTSHIVGPVVGGIIGGVALVLLAVTAWVFYLRRKSSRSHHRHGGSGGRGYGGSSKGGRWNGLSSKDSGLNATIPAPPPVAVSRSSGRGTTESTSGILSTNNSTLGHDHHDVTSVGSEEDLATLADEEKASKHGTFDYMDSIAPLPYTGQRRTSVSSRTSPVSPTPPMSLPRTRSTSQNRAMTLAQLEHPQAPTPSHKNVNRYSAARQSLDGRVLSTTSDAAPMTSPTSPTYYPNPSEMVPIGRSGSTGAGRRATRKPVPTYVANDSETGYSLYSSTGGNESSTGSSVNIPPSASRSREELPVPAFDLQHLSHKSSFGDGRPMHYLIPDMPPPQRE